MAGGSFGSGVDKPLQDFGVALGLGAIRNTNGNRYRRGSLLGSNPSISSGTPQAVTTGGGQFLFPQAPVQIRVASGGDPDDGASGSGARTVVVSGLNASGELATESISLSGSSESALTSTSFWRFLRAAVSESGTYGGRNEGTITIETSAGDELAQISPGGGTTKHGTFSIPSNYVGLLRGFTMIVEGSKEITFDIFVRERFTDVAEPFGPANMLSEFRELSTGLHNVSFTHPLPMKSLSDIWIDASSASASSSAFVSMAILLVPNK